MVCFIPLQTPAAHVLMRLITTFDAILPLNNEKMKGALNPITGFANFSTFKSSRSRHLGSTSSCTCITQLRVAILFWKCG